jgi:ABC-type transport system involved in multi-copper enzyme maturation permease subunit
MTWKQTLSVWRWLAYDTFRQAVSGRLFWLMLGISAVVIVFCLGVRIDGGGPLHAPDDFELSKPHGQLTLGFGAFRGPLFRDGEAAVRFLELVLGEWVAGAAGVLLALLFTAGFVPTFLEPPTAAVLLSKPVPRWSLLLGKYSGVLAFVAFQGAVFVVGTWLALGLRTGYFPASYLACLPLLLLHFGVVYSGSVLLGVCTRSTVASMFGAVILWLLCWGMNYGRHMVVALPVMDPATAQAFPPGSQALVEAGYWLLPKPADMGLLLHLAVVGPQQPCSVPQMETVRQMGAFYPGLSLLSSLAFAAGMLFVSARHLKSVDY